MMKEEDQETQLRKRKREENVSKEINLIKIPFTANKGPIEIM